MKMEDDINVICENMKEDLTDNCIAENDEELNVSTHDGDSFLIELVEAYPHIYDNQNPDFKDANKKEQAWSEIASTMDWPIADCQNRWLRLRERYARETRTMELEMSRGVIRRSAFALYDRLNFLKNHVKRRRSYPKMMTGLLHQNNIKRPNLMQAVSTTSPATTNSSSETIFTPAPVTHTNQQPATLEIHQPALVQIIKPARVSTVEEPRKNNACSSDVTSTRVGGVTIPQTTSGNFSQAEAKFPNHLNGLSEQRENNADVLFGQFVTAELLKMPEHRRKQIKQKIVQITQSQDIPGPRYFRFSL